MIKFRSSTLFVFMTVFALVLGACATATAVPTATSAPAPTTAPATASTTAPTALPNTGPTSAANGATIKTAQDATLGAILTDANGMTIYAFTKDAPGKSNCTGDCAGIWPPVTVAKGATPAAGSGVSATLGTITRDDGTTQVTVNNMPVYTWVKDKKAGDTTGQGIGSVWFVLDASGSLVKTLLPTAAPTSASASASTASQGPTIKVADTANFGSILTNAAGMTLYFFTKDSAGVSNCDGQCASYWPPLLVSNGATPTAAAGFTGTLGTIQRKDGTTQVTVNNLPVYLFAKDKNAGDVTGQGVGKTWFVIDATGNMMNK